MLYNISFIEIKYILMYAFLCLLARGHFLKPIFVNTVYLQMIAFCFFVCFAQRPYFLRAYLFEQTDVWNTASSHMFSGE